MKIDIHTHILPNHIPAFADRFGYKGFIQLRECPGCTDLDMISDEGKFFRRIDNRCFDPKSRAEDVKKIGVDVQVLSTLPVMMSYWVPPKDGLEISQFLNDHLSEVCAASPKRFVALGNVPMQAPDLAVKELTRLKANGFCGVQIGTNIHGKNLSEPMFEEFWQACEQLKMSVFVHPWEMPGQEQMQKYWLPWLVGMPAETSRAICSLMFAGVFDRFPSLQFCFAHGGGSFPFTLGRIQHGFESRPDLVAVDNKNPPSNYLRRFFVDSLVHDERSFEFLLSVFGEDNICLGSDYPFPLGETSPGKLVEKSNCSAEVKKKILHRNAETFLGRTFGK